MILCHTKMAAKSFFFINVCFKSNHNISSCKDQKIRINSLNCVACDLRGFFEKQDWFLKIPNPKYIFPNFNFYNLIFSPWSPVFLIGRPKLYIFNILDQKNKIRGHYEEIVSYNIYTELNMFVSSSPYHIENSVIRHG